MSDTNRDFTMKLAGPVLAGTVLAATVLAVAQPADRARFMAIRETLGKERHQMAGDAASPPQQSKVVFERIVDFSSLVPPTLDKEFDVLVNNGRVARDYPASFYALAQECTATLIGPSVVLTAAHCLSYPSNGKPEPISLVNGLTGFEAKCYLAPGYNPHGPGGNLIQDWALCQTLAPQTLPAEVVNTDKRLTERGDAITITGFGCDLVHGRRVYGEIFSTGVVRITDASVLGTDVLRAVSVRGVSLCDADSGGATFSVVGRGRVQVAVNSASNGRQVSTMSNLSSDPGIEFLHDWSACRGVVICGVDPNATGCRFKTMPKGNAKRKPVPKPCRPEWT